MSNSEAQRPTYRTLYVPTQMGQLHSSKKVRKQVGVHKVTRTEGVFKKKEVEVEEPIFEDRLEYTPTGELSDTFIDQPVFIGTIEDACNSMAEAGYEVISIMPIIRGAYSWRERGVSSVLAGLAGGYGYGYSYTDGAVITARLLK
ncbi:hypothetical protein [Salinisphaera sp. T31B1]|uniref:hypothetical protein n=1 Tax=Salinisphaera sp. T31B1 TaxID=727963 RepID=UPI003342C15A